MYVQVLTGCQGTRKETKSTVENRQLRDKLQFQTIMWELSPKHPYWGILHYLKLGCRSTLLSVCRSLPSFQFKGVRSRMRKREGEVISLPYPSLSLLCSLTSSDTVPECHCDNASKYRAIVSVCRSVGLSVGPANSAPLSVSSGFFSRSPSK